MRNNFRQGLITYPKDGTGAPQFLLPAQNPSFVNLNVSPTAPTLATFAHGSSDYLQGFETAIPNAWGPMIEGVDNYLYWDIDLLTSQVTFGITALEPVVSVTEPEHVNDLHWFDLNTNKLKVWSTVSGKWLERVRLFAGVVENGNTTQLTTKLSGSQVGLNTASRPGFILLDSLLRPVRTSAGEFLTTDSPVHVKTTIGTSGVLATPLNAFIPIRAGENIPAMSVVYFSSEDTVSLASSDPALINQKTPIGIVQDDLATNEVGVLTQTGDIMWDQWDWSASIGKPLYVNSAGQLTPTRPQGLLAYRVGFVKNRNTILLQIDAETNPQVYSASAAEVIVAGTTPITAEETTNTIGERVVTISLPAATVLAPGHMTAAQAIIVSSTPIRLDAIDLDLAGLHVSKSDVGHRHRLEDLDGVEMLYSPFENDVLTYQNGVWVSRPISFEGIYAPYNHNHDDRYALLLHTHEVAEVTGLQALLDGKASRTLGLLPFDRVFETVNQGGATDVGSGQTLTNALAGKAAVAHTHPISAVTGLQGALDGKAPLDHTHLIAHITGLQAALDSKADAGSGVQNLAELNDVSVTGAMTGNFLVYNGTDWVDQLPTLSLLDDVDVTTTPPASGNVLAWNGTNWVPEAPTVQSFGINDMTDVDTVSVAPANGNVLVWSTSNWVPQALQVPQSIDDLADVDTESTSPSVGDLLTWTGTVWEPQAPPEQTNTLDSLLDVAITGTPATNEVLSYVGGVWQPRQLTTNVKPAPLATSAVTDNILFGSASHHNAHLRSTSASNVQVTVQPDSYWTGTEEYWANDYNPTDPGPMPVGGSAVIGKHAAGDITFVAAAGVTINTPDTLTLSKLHGKVTLIKVAVNVWDLEGNLATA